jgi:amino acid permease
MTVTNFSYLLPFIGVAAYSIEGIGLLLPLRKDFLMSRHSNSEYKTYYFASFGFIVFLYITFGIFNYLKFFNRIKTIVFYNYTPQNWFIFSLEIAYAVVGSQGAISVQHDEPLHRLQLGLQSAVGPQPDAHG